MNGIETRDPWTGGLIRVLGAAGVISAVEAEDHKDYYGPPILRRFLLESGFPAGAIRQGYFELFMNTWTLARK